MKQRINSKPLNYINFFCTPTLVENKEKRDLAEYQQLSKTYKRG